MPKKSAVGFTMRLYHGTSSIHLESILENGLLARGDGESKWQASSSGERVYLTNAYAMYFAQYSREKESEDLLIVEIDTELLPDQSPLQADEDAAWFVFQSGGMERDLRPPPGMTDKHEQAMHFSRLLDVLSDRGLGYEKSLALLGNCSHEGTVPPSAITRILRYSASDGPWWLFFHDPTISRSNFRFNGFEYRATRLIVADRQDEARQIVQLTPGFIDLERVEESCAPRRTIVSLR